MKEKKNQFVKSERIFNFYKQVDSLNLDTYKSDKTNFCEIQIPLIRKALKNICFLWNKEAKSRNFVKHLLSSFIPVYSENKRLSFTEKEISEGKDKCAILGIKLTGINDIARLASSMIIERARIDLASTDEEKQKAIDKYNQKLNTFPKEQVERKFAYFSESSDKFLSNEGIIALVYFMENFILLENEIAFTLNKRRLNLGNKEFPKKKRLNNKQINEIARANTYGMSSHISKDTFNKLKELKEDFDKENKSDNK